VPETLQGLILTRFDRLPPNQRRVLQTASVVGYQFSVPVLLHVLRQGILEKMRARLDTLDLLVEREFIARPGKKRAEETLQTYASSTCWSRMRFTARCCSATGASLHTRTGQAIEQIYSDRMEGQIEVLAGHFLRSRCSTGPCTT
jgi:predicted ATPase